MAVAEQAETLEQSVSRALLTAEEEGVEEAPGPKAAVALRRAEVQVLRSESWSSEVRNWVQFWLRPVGMSCVEIECMNQRFSVQSALCADSARVLTDWAHAVDARREIRAIYFIVFFSKQKMRVGG